MTTSTIAQAKYLAFTTTRKNGQQVSTPVWVVDLGDGRAGFTTSLASGKVKRLRHTPQATVQPSDSRGNPLPGTTPVAVLASVVQGAEVEQIRELVKKKYGSVMVAATKAFASIAGFIRRKPVAYADAAVVFTLL